MTTKHATPGPAGRSGPRYAGPRSTSPSRAIPWALWLAAVMVAAVAAAAEAPPSSQTPPPPPPPVADAPKPDAQAPARPEGETPPPDAPKPDAQTPAKPEGEAPPPGAPKPDGETPAKPEGDAPAKPEVEPEFPPIVPGEPLRLNFKDASLHAVLEYFSEATGMVIVQEPIIDGRVTILSRQPLSTEEAIALLDTVLKSKGYAAIRTGRNLRIVPLSQAGKENVPVFSGSDPEQIPVADMVVTQIIPVRYADATKLKTDLTPLIPSTATLTANAASNTLVLVDTQASIRRIVEIVKALDGQMSGVAEVKVFQLKYANATNAAKLITDLFKPDDQQAAQSSRRMFPFFDRGGPGGRGGDQGAQSSEKSGREQKVIATADDRTNTLVISAPPDMLKTIEGIIKELDSNPSEEQAVFTYRLKNADAKNLETVLNNIFSEYSTAGGAGRTTTPGQARGGMMSQFGRGGAQQIAATANDLVGQVFVVADADTNSLLVRTASKHFERVQEILKDLDRAIPQVLIKVLVAEVTHDDELDLGTEFSILNLQFGATVNGTGDLGGTDERAGGLVTANMNSNLTATFNALQRDGRLDVLSRPYILTSDNQEATITIGQEVPFIRNSRTTETGQTVNTIEYEDVGIILKVTPHVNPQGLVNLDVAPEISTVLTDTTVPLSETVNAAVIAKRSAQTKVAIMNGQTIVIGGLMEDRITDGVRKVPGLGDIPLLGALFRHTTKKKVKTELLIFLTPHVAEQPEHLQAMSKDEMAGTKAVQDAAGQGAFQDHMDAMNRGATPQTPPGEPGETQQP